MFGLVGQLSTLTSAQQDDCIQEESGCPCEGSCDDPDVRDLYLQGVSTKVIRVFIHVLADDDGSNPAASAADVVATIDQLNTDFAPYRFQFDVMWDYIYDTALNDPDSNGAGLAGYAVLPCAFCNVYVWPGQNAAVATFPWSPNHVALSAGGGIRINPKGFGLNSLGEVSHLLTHEMGHCLGLLHTFHWGDLFDCNFGIPECYANPDGSNPDTTGDFCSDTPPDPAQVVTIDGFQTTQCLQPTGSDCFGTPYGWTDQTNFMSYGSLWGYGCADHFTPQQAARMHCWTEAALITWVANADFEDCNDNDISDRCDIFSETSADVNGNGIPDECETL